MEAGIAGLNAEDLVQLLSALALAYTARTVRATRREQDHASRMLAHIVRNPGNPPVTNGDDPLDTYRGT